MNIKQLEHILRASGSITGCREIVVIGSQSLLASFPNAPDDLLGSMEVDCYPNVNPGRADLIDGSIGELSPFHETFGCCPGLYPLATTTQQSIPARARGPGGGSLSAARATLRVSSATMEVSVKNFRIRVVVCIDNGRFLWLLQLMRVDRSSVH
jgi:hypothetical protein